MRTSSIFNRNPQLILSLIADIQNVNRVGNTIELVFKRRKWLFEFSQDCKSLLNNPLKEWLQRPVDLVDALNEAKTDQELNETKRFFNELYMLGFIKFEVYESGERVMAAESVGPMSILLSDQVEIGEYRFRSAAFILCEDVHYRLESPQSDTIVCVYDIGWFDTMIVYPDQVLRVINKSNAQILDQYDLLTEFFALNQFLQPRLEKRSPINSAYKFLDPYQSMYHRILSNEYWGYKANFPQDEYLPKNRIKTGGISMSAKLKISNELIRKCEDLISDRRSARKTNSGNATCSLDKLSVLLDYISGPAHYVSDVSNNKRSIPSAGGLHALRFYLLAFDVEKLESGLYSYDSQSNLVYPVSKPRNELVKTYRLFTQSIGDNADPNAIILITVNLAKISSKYGVKALAFALVEMGCVYELLHLLCKTLNLGGCSIGNFRGEIVNCVFNLTEDGVLPIGAFALFGSKCRNSEY